VRVQEIEANPASVNTAPLARKETRMKKFLTLAAVALFAAASALPAAAQEWPKKQPIKIVVGASAGGGTDVLARVTAEYLQRRIGQAVVVENRVGAGQSIAVDFVAKSAPDGYTFMLIYNDLMLYPAVRSDLPYKYDEMTYLIRPFAVQPVLFVAPKVQAKTVQEFIAEMKANPGRIKYGSAGIGGLMHLMIAQFETAAGVKGVHIPYAGAAPVYQDMLGGTLEYTIATPPNPEGIKVIASLGFKRHPLYPNVPTLEELGIKGATLDVAAGFVAPPKMPKALADRIIAELQAVMRDPEAILKYQTAAKYTPDLDAPTGEAFKKLAVEEHLKWKAVVAREKIVVQQ
jgi:tripartite-type tricarboxylate transporter receptor subunit TctC